MRVLHYIDHVRREDLLSAYLTALTTVQEQLGVEVCVATRRDAIGQKLRSFRPHIVHVHTIWSWRAAQWVRLAGKQGCGVVVSPHGALDAYRCRHERRWSKLAMTVLYQRRMVSRADALLASTDHEAARLARLGWNDQTDTIVYTSPEFQPCADTFSDKYAFVGPSIRPATENIEKTHDVLIYISMGTVNNDLLPFYRACIAAFADSPYQVILSTGEQIDRSALGTLPDNITALPHVDQIAVLQKADVFLSHCGMNSASESLYFGVPLVLFPQTNEQGGVAARVAELGAGLKLEKAGAASIRTAVDAVLQTPSYRANAQKIRESFLRCGGAKAAVDRILSVADRK